MRKADLVNAISEKTGVAKVDVLVSLEELFKEIKTTMQSGENVLCPECAKKKYKKENEK